MGSEHWELQCHGNPPSLEMQMNKLMLHASMDIFICICTKSTGIDRFICKYIINTQAPEPSCRARPRRPPASLCGRRARANRRAAPAALPLAELPAPAALPLAEPLGGRGQPPDTCAHPEVAAGPARGSGLRVRGHRGVQLRIWGGGVPAPQILQVCGDTAPELQLRGLRGS